MNIKASVISKQAVLALALVALVATAGFLGTRAFFSDSETSQANVFAAGSLDLEVGIWGAGDEDNFLPKSIPGNQALFAFNNLIPGDSDTGRFLFESSQDAWLCVAADVTAENENTRLDVETDAGDGTDSVGELGQFMQIAVWQDNNNDGDGVVGISEKDTLQVMSLHDFANGNYRALQDSTNGTNPLAAGEENHQEFAYCFGEFSNYVDVSNNGGTLACDGGAFGSDTNKAQTDSVETTIHFYAEQMQNNEDFACSSLSGDGLVDGKVTNVVMSTRVDAIHHGINVKSYYSSIDFTDAVGMTVAITRADGSVVTKKMRSNRVDEYINDRQYTTTSISTPFPIHEGSYSEAASTSWHPAQPANAVWDASTEPVSVTVTIIEADGTATHTSNVLDKTEGFYSQALAAY